MHSKWMRHCLWGAMAALPMLAAQPAQATLVTGTAAFADTGPASSKVGFTAVFNAGNEFNFDLTAGTPVTISDFLTITSDANALAKKSFGGTATENIATNFTFTQPGAASGTVSGQGTETISKAFGFITEVSGAINWGGPAAIDFADGTIIDIALSDASFDINQLLAFPNQSVDIDATFTLMSEVHTVPEPAALALLGAGLLGFTALRRRQGIV